MNHFETEISQTRQLLESRTYNQAHHFVSQLIVQNPYAAIPQNLLAVVLDAMGDSEHALIHFRIAWILEPQNRVVNYNLSLLDSHFRTKKYALTPADCAVEHTLSSVRLEKHGNVSIIVPIHRSPSLFNR